MHDFKYIYIYIFKKNWLSKYFMRKDMHSTHLTVLKDPHNVPLWLKVIINITHFLYKRTPQGTLYLSAMLSLKMIFFEGCGATTKFNSLYWFGSRGFSGGCRNILAHISLNNLEGTDELKIRSEWTQPFSLYINNEHSSQTGALAWSVEQ